MATLNYVHLYTGPDKLSHFKDVEVDLADRGAGSFLSETMQATGLNFRKNSKAYDLDWHPAPRRQFIVNLAGAVKITASDGEVRTIGVGEVLLVEDTTGKGHLSKAVEGKLRHCIFVPVE